MPKLLDAIKPAANIIGKTILAVLGKVNPTAIRNETEHKSLTEAKLVLVAVEPGSVLGKIKTSPSENINPDVPTDVGHPIVKD